MGEIVNLNRIRKQKQRAATDAAAATNRARFGRTLAERKRDAREQDDRDRLLEGKRLTDGASGGGESDTRPEGKG
ncbi:MAG: DUF4169 family protein [Pseudomonadota bacterium]|nr:DUF4169 family protein [Pseudomonadota bacterium]